MDIDAIDKLHEIGAHIIKLNSDGLPAVRSWNTRVTCACPETCWVLLSLRKHVKDGGKIGVAGVSVGVVCVDVDSGDPARVIERLGNPLWKTRSNGLHDGYHLYYKCRKNAVMPKKLRGGKFAVNGTRGDIKGLWARNGQDTRFGGYSRLAKPSEFLAALNDWDSATWVKLSKLDGAVAEDERTKQWLFDAEFAGEWDEFRQQMAMKLENEIADLRVAQDNRNETLNTVAYIAGLDGWEPESVKLEARTACIDNGYYTEDAEGFEATFESGFTAGSTQRQLNTVTREEHAIDRGSYGIAQALEVLGIDVRFNKVAKDIEYRMDEGRWQLADEQLLLLLHADLATDFNWRASGKPVEMNMQTLRGHLFACAQKNMVVPFLDDYLIQLPAWQDGWATPADLFETAFDMSLTKLQTKVWNNHMVAMVRRQLGASTNIPYRYHLVVMLTGSGGVGKSSFFEELLPEELRETLLITALNLQQPMKDIALDLAGRVVCIMDEAVGLRQADVRKTKNLISNYADTLRRPYAPAAATVYRSAVFVGTTNETNFLARADSGIARRFCVISIPRSASGERVIKYMRSTSMRDEAWAWAYAKAVDSEYQTYLTKSEEQELVGAAKMYWADDSGTVETVEHAAEWMLWQYGFAVPRDIARAVRIDTWRVRNALEELGWQNLGQSRTMRGVLGRPTTWVPKELDEVVDDREERIVRLAEENRELDAVKHKEMESYFVRTKGEDPGLLGLDIDEEVEMLGGDW